MTTIYSVFCPKLQKNLYMESINFMGNIAPFRVLSLDGGGMRGLYTAAVLNYLSEQFLNKRHPGSTDNCQLDIGSAFNLITGTSTGGILACALASGIGIHKIMELYRMEGPKIFSDPVPESNLQNLTFCRWLARNRRKPANENDHLQKVLIGLFGEETLSELYSRRRIALCIPSVKLIDEKAKVFKTPHHPEKLSDRNLKLVDICLATSAAPIYLPLFSIPAPHDPGTTEVFCDGGLWANNPVLIGLIEALDLSDIEQPIEILSIGTCAAPEGSILEESELHRGILDWQVGTKALSLSMNAQASGSTYMVELFANIFRKYGKQISVFRVPESAPSTDQIPHLKMDLASDKALQAFTSLGANDGLRAYRLIHDKGDPNGQLINRLFDGMNTIQRQK